MCGIAGVASVSGSPTIDYHRLRAMTDSLFHRGPDESGSEICDGFFSVGSFVRYLSKR